MEMLHQEIQDDSSDNHKAAQKQVSYPSHVVDVPYGKALVASIDLEPGTIVQKFWGAPVPEYSTLSDYDKCYVLQHETEKGSGVWVWLLPKSDARFANHSCAPNSIINDQMQLETISKIKAGDQITFLYNNGSETDDWWDPVWTFKCCCGAVACQGMIDRYRPKN